MLTPSDWISIAELLVSAIGICVSAIVAVWIVDNIQKKMDIQHSLKGHFASEVLGVRMEYRGLISDLISTKQKPSEIKKNFRKINIHASNLLQLLNTQYGVPNEILLPYQMELQQIATDSNDFVNAFRNDRKFAYRQDTVVAFQNFEKLNDHLFNDILIKIYNG